MVKVHASICSNLSRTSNWAMRPITSRTSIRFGLGRSPKRFLRCVIGGQFRRASPTFWWFLNFTISIGSYSRARKNKNKNKNIPYQMLNAQHIHNQQKTVQQRGYCYPQLYRKYLEKHNEKKYCYTLGNFGMRALKSFQVDQIKCHSLMSDLLA